MKLLKIKLVPLVLFTLILGYLFAQRIHETGHWFFLQIFQREPNIGFLGLIQVWSGQPTSVIGWSLFTDPVGGSQGWFWLSSLPQSNSEWIGMLMMGQVFQVLTIVLGLVLIFQAKNIIVKNAALIIVLFNSFSQVIYQTIKFFNVFGGDEYSVAFFGGFFPRLLTGPLVIFYGVVLVLVIFQLDGWKEKAKYLFAVLLAQAIGPILGFFDSIIRQQAILSNPLVNPVFGFSLPVIVLDLIMVIAFWFSLKYMRKMQMAG